VILDTQKFALKPEQWVAHVGIPTYDRILLHFTAGYTAAGAYSGWMSDKTTSGQQLRVATPFLVDKPVKGVSTVYQCFDPAKGWAWHVGGTEVCPTEVNTRSIGIEVVCEGPLKLSGKTLIDCYGKPYCTLAETTKYLAKSWRGYDFWSVIPPPQQTALKELVHSLCATWNIPLVPLPADKRMSVCPTDASKWSGIVAHHNFVSWKWDTGVLVDQDWLCSK
jgi:N-acetyl-anhydromuramyl-L-alanine amidase AmpD